MQETWLMGFSLLNNFPHPSSGCLVGSEERSAFGAPWPFRSASQDPFPELLVRKDGQGRDVYCCWLFPHWATQGG